MDSLRVCVPQFERSVVLLVVGVPRSVNVRGLSTVHRGNDHGLVVGCGSRVFSHVGGAWRGLGGLDKPQRAPDASSLVTGGAAPYAVVNAVSEGVVEARHLDRTEVADFDGGSG